jgi:fermentation-respiration switch protein FrsA (DUF1100 family)
MSPPSHIAAPGPRPRRRRWATWLLGAGALAALAYVGLIAYLVIYQTDLIFRPRHTLAMVPASLGLEPERVALRGAAGTPLVAWRIRAGDAATHPFWIVYLHGNDATRASDGNVTRYHQLRSLGLNVLAPEYPGYADVAGDPSEPGLLEAARAAYDELRTREGIDGRRIAIYGWSLGTGGAAPLARDVDEAALVLEGAFSSVLRRAQAAYPYLPISLMVRHRFLSEDAIASVGSPVLFLHSPEDAIIPFSDGQRLYGRARTPKQFVELRGGHITPNLDDEDRYLGSLYTFLTSQAHWTLTPPRRSAAVAVRSALDRDGVRSALDTYARCRSEGPAVWNLAEYELEHVGRRLVFEERDAAAIAILRANAEIFRTSPMAFVHLGRAYAADKDTAHARQAFERSLELDASPANPSREALRSLP